MLNAKRPSVLLIFAALLISTPKAISDDSLVSVAEVKVPVTGKPNPKYEAFDEVMLKYRQQIGCTAATLAVSKSNRILYSRGYGWLDIEQTTHTTPDTHIGIASCSKPMIAAAIKKLAKEKHVQLDSKLIKVCRIKLPKKIADKRVRDITLQHLIDHTAGWGANPRTPALRHLQAGDPTVEVSTRDMLEYALTQPLEDEPGTARKYCNFGYHVLKYIVEKWSKKLFPEYACRELLKTKNLSLLHAPGQVHKGKQPTLAWNVDNYGGGTVSASAKTLCLFMHKYWFTGEPRRSGKPYWFKYGSLPGSTALMIWRPDGYNIAVVFNGRKVPHELIRDDLNGVIDQLK